MDNKQLFYYAQIEGIKVQVEGMKAANAYQNANNIFPTYSEKDFLLKAEEIALVANKILNNN